MNMKTRNWIIVIGLVFGLVVLAFRPVPIPEEKDCLVLRGTVSEVSIGGVNDVIFKLRGKLAAFKFT